MAEYDNDTFRLTNNLDGGTAVSPTSLDEKEDVADDGSKRGTDTSSDSMVIVNPLMKKDEYDYRLSGSSYKHDDAELTDEERAALEKAAAEAAEAEEKERKAFKSGDEEYLELNRRNERYHDQLSEEFDIFPSMLSTFDDGDFSLELKKRYMLKAIDEAWIKMIEDHLTPLDTIIRSPGRFIEQNEQILPIELSKNITTRSIQHLGQHTNFISKVEGDMITPSKILNVFNDETMLTYENKFINTLINRLYVFIAKRYQAAIKSGRDEKCTMLDFGGRFSSGKLKGKVKLAVEISEEPEEDVKLKNYYFTTDLWHRVEKLYKIVQNYMASDFVTQMGKAYIRPPVMRTNAILRNKNMRQCLELWEFIESYENLGYEMLIQETAEDVNDKYKKELYKDAALQFLLFRYNVKNDFNDEETLASASTELPLSPKLVSKIKPFDANDYNEYDTIYEKTVNSGLGAGGSGDKDTAIPDREIERSIDLALVVDDIIDGFIKAERERRRIEEERRRAEEERRRQEEERRRLEEERRKEEERRRLEEERQRELERQRKEEEERQRLEEERRKAEEAEEKARQEAEEAARAAAEENARKLAEAEEAARIAAEENAKKLAEAEEAARAAAEEEARRLAQEAENKAKHERNKKISRKKKKKIRRAAEEKATGEGVELSKTFDYDEYTRYLEK